VVLADPEDVEADLLGERDLLEQVAHAPGRVLVVQLREGVDADLHQAKVARRDGQGKQGAVGPLTPQWSLAGTPPTAS
jgi:hypothetical protein